MAAIGNSGLRTILVAVKIESGNAMSEVVVGRRRTLDNSLRLINVILNTDSGKISQSPCFSRIRSLHNKQGCELRRLEMRTRCRCSLRTRRKNKQKLGCRTTGLASAGSERLILQYLVNPQHEKKKKTNLSWCRFPFAFWFGLFCLIKNCIVSTSLFTPFSLFWDYWPSCRSSDAVKQSTSGVTSVCVRSADMLFSSKVTSILASRRKQGRSSVTT